MIKLIGLVLMALTLAGCASRYGKLPDGREYKEYDVDFNKDKGRFDVPLEAKSDTAGIR
ncbi:MAG: hypothetical protein PHR91_07545 [Candidatus Omnitrophica bacterium]|nr:hypothetical protein [Candidatus Omnitrophota bacterium]